jgi:hypothetical protein
LPVVRLLIYKAPAFRSVFASPDTKRCHIKKLKEIRMAVLVGKQAPFFAGEKPSPPFWAMVRLLTTTPSRKPLPANMPWCSSTRWTSPLSARPS